MTTISGAMLLHNKPRLVLTIAGISVSFFLSASQIGLMIGWCNTNSAIIRHARADIWLIARQTRAFDYGTAIPRNRVFQARSVPGVGWAEGLFVGWNYWQCPDGRVINIELIGLDESSVAGPWSMHSGNVDAVQRPDTVLIDHLYLKTFGVERTGQEVEIFGRSAVVGGISKEIRTFTAAPHVFTSLESAIRYDKRYRDDEITYVLVRCAQGFSPEGVRDSIAAIVPHVEVLTSDEFASRSVCYWMLETGVGITVVITAALGLLVGAFIMSQTLYAITQDHLGNYATLLALGFGRGRLTGVVLAQSIVLGAGGIAFGAVLFFVASYLSRATPIPLETTEAVFAGVVLLSWSCCLLASLASIRTLFKIDPASVFRA